MRSSSTRPPPLSVIFLDRGRMGRIERAVLDAGTDSERLAIVRKALEHREYQFVDVNEADPEEAFRKAFARMPVPRDPAPGDTVIDSTGRALVYNHLGGFAPATIRLSKE